MASWRLLQGTKGSAEASAVSDGDQCIAFSRRNSKWQLLDGLWEGWHPKDVKSGECRLVVGEYIYELFLLALARAEEMGSGW